MKKRMIIAFLVLAIGLTACGNNQDSTQDNTNSQSNSEGESTEQSSEDEFEIETPGAYEGEVLCDNDNYTIIVDKIEVDEDFMMTLSIINKASHDIRFLINEPAINGLMYDKSPEFVSVKKGETKKHEIEIRESWLKKYDMRRITEVFYTIEATNQGTEQFMGTELCASYPYREAEYFEYEPKATDVLVVDTEEYRVYAGLEVNGSSAKVQMYAQNNTDKTVRIGGMYPAVNNRMLSLDSNVATYVAPGKCAITTTTIGKDDLESVGMEKVEDIIKLSHEWTVTNHNKGLYTYGADTTETIYRQVADIYVSGKENVEVTLPEINGKQLWDNDYCTLYYVGNSYGEKATVDVCLINKTNRTLNVYLAENMIEDMVEGFGTETTVLSGAICYMSMMWQIEDLEEAEVDFGSADGVKYSFEMELHYADTEKFLYEKIFRNQRTSK